MGRVAVNVLMYETWLILAKNCAYNYEDSFLIFSFNQLNENYDFQQQK